MDDGYPVAFERIGFCTIARMSSDVRAAPLADLRDASCSDGAPSARNLLVTLFGDGVAPHGTDIALPVSALADLLGSFGANERLIRTSLTRLANDGMLMARANGRRSFYGIHDGSIELFAAADR